MKFMNVFITGASSGIGKELSLSYAAPGVVLGLLSINHDGCLDEVADSCRRKGAEVFSYVGDVSDPVAMSRCANDYLQRAGHVDLVIANAGIRMEESPDFSDHQIPERVISVNFLGVVHTISPFVPAMRRRGKGHLAAVSSIAAFRGTQNSGVYSASKAAVNIWMESLRLRLIYDGVKVCTLCAGFVDTAMTKGLTFWMPGMLTAKDAARHIREAIARSERVYVFPWQERLIWGTLSLIPGRVYDSIITWLKRNPLKR